MAEFFCDAPVPKETVLRLSATIAAAAALVAGTLATTAQAGPWLSPQLITAGGFSNPSLVTGGAGSAALAFEGSTSGSSNKQLFVAVRELGSVPTATKTRGFDSPVAISGAPREILSSSVIVDGAGNVTALWWAPRDPADDIYGAVVFVRTKPAGRAWGATQLIGTAQGFAQNSQNTRPELVGAADGRAAVLVDEGLFERAPGAVRFTPVLGTSTIRHIAMNAAGDLAAASYLANTGGSFYAARFEVRVRPAGGGWGPAAPLGLVSVGFPNEINRSAIAITPNGTVVTAWGQSDAAPFDPSTVPDGLFAAVRTPGASFASGTWSPARLIVRDPDNTFTDYAPRLRVDGASTVTVQSGLNQITLPGNGEVAPGENWQVSDSNAQGRLILVLPPFTSDGVLIVQVRPKTGAAIGQPTTVAAAAGTVTGYSNPSVALDEQGNGYLSWVRSVPAGAGQPAIPQVGISGYDPVAPVLSAVTASSATAGQPVGFSAKATDRMSVPKLTWSFGDGAPSTAGDAVSHTYAKAGTYTAKVTARDEAGNSASWNKTVVVGAALQ